MGSNIEKKPWTKVQPRYKNETKRLRAANFFNYFAPTLVCEKSMSSVVNLQMVYEYNLGIKALWCT